MKPKQTLCAAIFCVIGPFAGAARAELRAEIVAFGAVTAEREQPAPQTLDDQGLAPRTWIEGIRFINRTSTLQAQLCLRFGVLIRLTGTDRPPSHVTTTLTHPRLTRPDQVSGTEDTYPTPVDNNLVYAGWSFDQPWELQPGDWTLTFRHEGRVLATKTFTVAVPTPATSLCTSNQIS